MNPIPPDKEDTLEVQGTFADLVAKVKRRIFFESQRPLGASANCVQVTQMSQEEDIEVDDDNSVTSKDLAPMPMVKKSVTFSSTTTTNPTLFSNVSTSTSTSSSSTRPVTRSTASRFNSAKWHSKIGVKKKKVVLKVQVGALVKKCMRVPVGNNKTRTAVVFGTIIKKWGRRWEIQFQNDRELRLMSREFKVV